MTAKPASVPWGDFVRIESVDPKQVKFTDWYLGDNGEEKYDAIYQGQKFQLVLSGMYCEYGWKPFKAKDGTLSFDIGAELGKSGIVYDPKANKYLNVPPELAKAVEVLHEIDEMNIKYIAATKDEMTSRRYKRFLRDDKKDPSKRNLNCKFHTKLTRNGKNAAVDPGKIKTTCARKTKTTETKLDPDQAVLMSRKSTAHYYMLYSGVSVTDLGVAPQVRVRRVEFTIPGKDPNVMDTEVEVDSVALGMEYPDDDEVPAEKTNTGDEEKQPTFIQAEQEDDRDTKRVRTVIEEVFNV
jgi:hypothetical protein